MEKIRDSLGEKNRQNKAKQNRFFRFMKTESPMSPANEIEIAWNQFNARSI